MWERTKEAVQKATKIVEAAWIKNGMAIAKSGQYARSIHSVFIDSDNEIIGIVFNTAPYASALEHGLKPFDMKPYFMKSKRIKISKKGKKYLTIPFRHGIPGTVTMPAMPENIYKEVKKKGRLGKSDYGIRSKIIRDKEKGELARYTWKTGLYSNMVRKGIKGHSQYLTFRVVSENSPAGSWWHPGIQAKHIAQRTAEEVAPEIEEIITKAINEDIQSFLEGGENA